MATKRALHKLQGLARVNKKAKARARILATVFSTVIAEIHAITPYHRLHWPNSRPTSHCTGGPSPGLTSTSRPERTKERGTGLVRAYSTSGVCNRVWDAL